MAVLVNRPLNAIVEGRLLRLADPPEYAGAPSFSDQLQIVKELEAEFNKTIAPSLKLAKDGPRPTDIFRWAEQLGGIGAELDSLEQWREIEAQAVAPRIMQTVGALDRMITGPLAERWHAWQERYMAQIDALLAALRKRAADRSRRRSLTLARALDPMLPADRRTASLSQKSLYILRSAPGVTSVLVGMRDPAYVTDALAMTGWPPLENAKEILTASRGVELP